MLTGKDILLLFLSAVLVSTETAERKPPAEEKQEDEAGENPATSTIEEIEDDEGEPFKHIKTLDHKWTFYYEDKIHKEKSKMTMNKTDYLKEVKKGGTFDSIISFWDSWNTVQRNCEIGDGVNYQLFKTGIKPLWEDPKNAKGGKCVVVTAQNIPLSLTLKQFTNLMLFIILGEIEVNGMVLSIRSWGNMFAIWIKDAKDKNNVDLITKKMTDLFGREVEVKFQRHQNTLRKMSAPNSTHPETSFEEVEQEKRKKFSASDAARGKLREVVAEPLPISSDSKKRVANNVQPGSAVEETAGPQDSHDTIAKGEHLTTLGKIGLGVLVATGVATASFCTYLFL